MLRLRLLLAALVGALTMDVPQPGRSAPPDRPSAERSADQPAGVAAASLLDRAVRERRLIAEVIQREVDAALSSAQATLADNPSAAIQDLKTMLHLVLAAPDLPSDRRADLRRRLETALRDGAGRAAELERQQLARQQSLATARERARVAGSLENRQQRIKQLIDRFDSLLSEGRYELADVVASQVDADRSSEAGVAAASAQGNLRLAGATRQALAMRDKRQQSVVRSLEQVELAGVALPGAEPIVYPQAERWQELTARRAKYARTDLHDATPAEARLSRALGEPTNFDFTDVPLGDAIAYLKDLHGIEIQFDAKVLADDGIDVDVPVTRRLSGISLRSALRLLLGALDLTYMIENEVLLVTSPDRAAHNVTTKVYPVGELVLPISMPNISGGFGPPGNFGGQNRGGQPGGGNQFNPLGQNQNNNQFNPGIF